ncbi:MAG: sugar nucleotide-binding protein [Clostridia bacterium]|nr:sugar nucleotide-binding protein [Clostridia bacterium]
MKILLTGARGFVGARIADDFPVIAAPSLRNAAEDDVKRLMDETEPDAIVHTAAISDIPTCEKNPEASYHANVQLPVWIAKTGIKAVLFSTDQVYGGCEGSGPYTEDETAPANLYARHKLEMERRVLDANPSAVLLRATWMYDMPLYGVSNRGNFLVNMLFGREAAFSGTQYRAVTYVREVARWTEQALSLPGGSYNFGSENSLTMLETAQWLKKRLNLPITLHDAGPRPHLWMNCGKAKAQGIQFMDTLDGLEQCIQDYAL